MSVVARLRHFAHAVVNDQPAVPGQDGRSAAADFEPLPGRHRSRQPVMRGKPAEAIWFTAFQGQRAVGNPDAFPIEIHLDGTRGGRRFPPDECRGKAAGGAWPVPDARMD